MSEIPTQAESLPESAPPPRRRRGSRLLPLFLALALGVPGGFLSARIVRIPLVDTLDTYRPNIITKLYTRSGALLAEYAIQRRFVIRMGEMSPHLINAIIATEDSNFYEHGGIDPKAILRAAIKDIIARKKVEGASTLTQQLARMLFLTPDKQFRRKINEVFLAIEIEKNFTKDQIFEMYANQVYVGHGAYGVEAASRLYFGKHAKDLTIPEAAVIAGVLQLPNRYSPLRNIDLTLQRRNHVLRRLLDRRYITREQFQQALDAPITLGSYREETPKVGAYFSEEVRQYLESHYGTEDLYRNGLEVWTTLDTKMQTAAEQALQKGLRSWDRRRGFRKPARNLLTEGLDLDTYADPAWTTELEPAQLIPAIVVEATPKILKVRFGTETIVLPPSAFAWTRKDDISKSLKRGDLVQIRFEIDSKNQQKKWYLDQHPLVQGAVVVLDVKTSEIRALVGGYDFNTSKFNRAVQALRQTGSAFKPIVFGAAFEKGFTPADTLFDAPIAIPMGNQTYAPRNYYGQYSGIVTIQRTLDLSINVPTVKAYIMVGGANVIDFARRCGVTAPLPQYPSLALGAAGISPLELTAAYNVWANQGVYIKPRMITKITDATQKVLEENYPELAESTSAQVAYLLTHALQGPIDRGTAYAAHALPGALAGKTGTTNGFTDAWFIGYSPEYSVGVWVGYDDPSRSLGVGAAGAEVALPIWMDIFKRIDALELRPQPPQPKFPIPAGIVLVPMDVRSGRRGSGPCGRVVEEAFIAGTEPDKDCSGAAASVTKLPYYLQRPFYQAKEMEPTQMATDATASPGEGGESPEPPPEELPAETPP